MEYRRLGNSDLDLSVIGLGSWLTYGTSVDRRRAVACLHRAFDLGVNFIDTANIYGRGAAESFLGEALHGVARDSYVLATKLFFPMTPEDKGLSATQIHKQLDASLRRLRVDHVDLYQCHRYDPATPLDETMAALTEVVRQGKVRWLGFSEWTRPQISAAMEMSNVERFVSSQPQYSLLWRVPEAEVFPYCQDHGIGQVVWSPLAQGVLTGKYEPGQPASPNTRAGDPSIGSTIDRFMKDPVLEAVARLKPVAARLGVSLPQLALAWTIRKPVVTSAIIGASRPEQIDQNAGAVGLKVDEDTWNEIEDILRSVTTYG